MHASKKKFIESVRNDGGDVELHVIEGDIKGSRFADKYVRANYNAVPMTGKRGGGFIFDTNAIHRGEMSGVRSRTVLLVEFMEEHKFKPLKHVGMGACAPARRPVTPTRADLCYEAVDREIVAKRC